MIGILNISLYIYLNPIMSCDSVIVDLSVVVVRWPEAPVSLFASALALPDESSDAVRGTTGQLDNGIANVPHPQTGGHKG